MGVVRQSEFWFQNLSKRISPRSLELDTVFWGGGTPSLIDDEITKRVLDNLNSLWNFRAAREFTIEVNPETLTLEKLKLWSALGINRLSVGIQSFDNGYLEKLERRARKKDNLRSLELIASHWNGKRGWSLDLMFGLPAQSLNQMLEDLELAVSFNPTHISSYQLTLTTKRSENWSQPGEETLVDMMLARKNFLEDRGFFSYEVSNFAKPGFESLHNKNYWQLNSFIGLGPGARGLLGPGFCGDGFGFHQTSPDNFDTWLKVAGDSEQELASLVARSASDHVLEKLMMGLRLVEGISLGSLASDLKISSDNLIQSLGKAQKLAWARETIDFGALGAGNLKLTAQGQKILDTLVPKIAALLI